MVTHQNLWLSLIQMSDWEKKRLLNAPVSTNGLFGPETHNIVHKFERQQRDSATLKSLMPHLSHNLLPACHDTPTQPSRSQIFFLGKDPTDGGEPICPAPI